MALPQLLKKSADKLLTQYCAGHDSRCGQHSTRLNYCISDNRVTLLEEQQGCPMQERRPARPVAQFRYQQNLMQWSLHYFSLSSTWVFYLNCGPSLDLSKILRHVDADPFGMFWS
jgi:Protein of unknown function (DUF3024)